MCTLGVHNGENSAHHGAIAGGGDSPAQCCYSRPEVRNGGYSRSRFIVVTPWFHGVSGITLVHFCSFLVIPGYSWFDKSPSLSKGNLSLMSGMSASPWVSKGVFLVRNMPPGGSWVGG